MFYTTLPQFFSKLKSATNKSFKIYNRLIYNLILPMVDFFVLGIIGRYQRDNVQLDIINNIWLAICGHFKNKDKIINMLLTFSRFSISVMLDLWKVLRREKT